MLSSNFRVRVDSSMPVPAVVPTRPSEPQPPAALHTPDAVDPLTLQVRPRVEEPEQMKVIAPPPPGTLAMTQETASLPALSGGATSELISQLYAKAGPRLGSLLIEPQVVLTLAGARAESDLSLAKPRLEDMACLMDLNQGLQDHGLRIMPAGDFLTSGTIHVQSLAGAQRVSRSTALPGVAPFDAATGWDGYHAWSDDTQRGLAQHLPSGYPLHHILTGLKLGYPDRALSDFGGWHAAGQPMPWQATRVSIAWSDQFDCRHPDFSVLEAGLSDPQVQRIEREWGRVLTDFYQQPWFQSLEKDPQYREARRQALQEMDDLVASRVGDVPPASSPERQRLGLSVS